jgi:dTDP-4-amino-4,6-dideoxygalactose transaminase
MIIDGYPLFEDDQTNEQVEKLSERVQKWLRRKRKWLGNLDQRLEELRRRHTDPSRTEHTVLRYAWVELLRDFVLPAERRQLVADLRETDLKVQNAGGPEAYEDQLAQSRGKSAVRSAKKAELAAAAGHSKDVRACVEWAIRWCGARVARRTWCGGS